MKEKTGSSQSAISTAKALIELTRLEHGIMYGIAVIIGIVLVVGLEQIVALSAVFGFFTALFIEMGAFALNDYIDLQADRIN